MKNYINHLNFFSWPLWPAPNIDNFLAHMKAGEKLKSLGQIFWLYLCYNLVFPIADNIEDVLARFKHRFAHFSGFFNLLEAEKGKNVYKGSSTYSLGFQCSICGKNVRANSRAPTSNLKSHISKCHPEILESFLNLREYNKVSSANSTHVLIKSE